MGVAGRYRTALRLPGVPRDQQMMVVVFDDEPTRAYVVHPGFSGFRSGDEVGFIPRHWERVCD